MGTVDTATIVVGIGNNAHSGVMIVVGIGNNAHSGVMIVVGIGNYWHDGRSDDTNGHR